MNAPTVILAFALCASCAEINKDYFFPRNDYFLTEDGFTADKGLAAQDVSDLFASSCPTNPADTSIVQTLDPYTLYRGNSIDGGRTIYYITLGHHSCIAAFPHVRERYVGATIASDLGDPEMFRLRDVIYEIGPRSNPPTGDPDTIRLQFRPDRINFNYDVTVSLIGNSIFWNGLEIK
ncbi:hypothetical protein [Pseudoroseicyclus aestuarii]|uniref:hypothetical protein n=1 Tax=Pseudoroseicyclus aestuarii TaxID=1795041 RepID=UPI0011B8031F|nr:hypothetical protein [Pseudoroseicyclus aestuarii]